MSAIELVERVLGSDVPFRVVTYDGGEIGPTDAATTIRIVSPNALHRIITARGQEIGFSRAIIAGEIEVEGDVFGLLEARDRVATPKLNTENLRLAFEGLGLSNVKDVAKLRPLPPPPEEVRLHGRRHSRARDAEAIASHYDVSNVFYRMLLGPAMTYSCAVYESAEQTLETAQFNKHDLICRKLALEPGKRLLDIGCGWGSLAIHAAKHYGATVVGVTISRDQADLAKKRVVEAGLADQISIRLQDYRDIADGPFDAVSSVGMAEHVGSEHDLRIYFDRVISLLDRNGRFLNHAISRMPGLVALGKNGFIARYVFPDGELHEAGRSLSIMHDAGFEVRHVETFREHYARTLRMWLDNLDANWDAAVDEVGRGRAWVWKLYMAGSALGFERNEIGLYQMLAVVGGEPSSSLPLRPDW